MVLYINGNYPHHSLHRELVTKLAEYGNEMVVFIPTKGKGLEENYPCDHPNVSIVYNDCLQTKDKVFFLSKIHRIVKEIEQTVDMKKIHCILAGTVYSDGFAAYLLHQKYNIPYSVAVRETDVTYQMKWRPYLNSLVRKVLENTTKVIFLSPSYRTYLDKFECDHEKYIDIPNGVNDYWFKEEDTQRTTHSPLSLIFVGEICKRKNVTTVINVVSELNKHNIHTVLHIVGTGNEEQRCRTMANEMGISNCIYFHGWINGKGEIKKIYDQADIFVMPSLRETFGTVYIEAISQGLPVIYTCGQGIDGYFDQGTIGYACDPLDIDDIEKAIERIVKNYQTMTSTCVFASKRFQWYVIAKQYNEIISQMRNK